LRRIVPILAIVVVLGIGGFFLLRPKGGGRSSKKPKGSSSDTSAVKKTAGTKARRTGKTTGRVKPKSKKELRAEKKARRKEERRRRREERRRQREERRRLKAARSKRGSRKKSKRGRGNEAYVVTAIVSLGDESYALVDGRRVSEGDVVMGRRIVAIRSDRLEVDAFGRRQTVRVGESLMPANYSTKRKR
jgi:hypothetical protein